MADTVTNTTSASTEFAIKYNRGRTSVPRLNSIDHHLPVKQSDAKLDVMAFIINCPKHETMAVYQDPTSGIKWLPFTQILPGM